MFSFCGFSKVWKNGKRKFHVFGVVGEYLQYIGWTERSLSDEKDIFLDLINHGGSEISDWLERTAQDDDIEVFEIERNVSMNLKHLVESVRV